MEATREAPPVLVLGPSHGMDALRMALRDVAGGLADWRLWTFLAQNDIRDRYRRSALGPLWLIVSLTVQTAAIGIVWGALLKQDIRTFIPYITIGLTAWTMLRGIVGDSCLCFVTSAHYITQTRRPLSTFVYQLLARNVLIFGHSLVVYAAVLVLFQVSLSTATLLLLPGFVLATASVSWVPLVLGPLGARFRDLHQLLQSVLQVIFFVTPVMWKADMLGQHAYIATANPLTHLIALIRDPLLGHAPPTLSWGVAIATAVLGWTAAVLVFTRVRHRIPYWL